MSSKFGFWGFFGSLFSPFWVLSDHTSIGLQKLEVIFFHHHNILISLSSWSFIFFPTTIILQFMTLKYHKAFCCFKCIDPFTAKLLSYLNMPQDLCEFSFKASYLLYIFIILTCYFLLWALLKILFKDKYKRVKIGALRNFRANIIFMSHLYLLSTVSLSLVSL